ncbi:molybdenum cofactor guanylyltransferase [Haloarcula pellucida]|uniref:Molybdenum cofactor guanylyltransferase n=1 Tax=Haloarcula pellucida TaxID=1427151 RepID=A0A830GN42_9EURY|nr:molybdenum cofactor guanylyltransferase [Halomicroarcula pellucida]MBX0349813.1 molybdenum cofactor guanylyltransferase [Halomicroarcula pellucida]GGN94493.1 molybdenum cofactor guanylyltransferase [Halomicroarcula pellucida]
MRAGVVIAGGRSTRFGDRDKAVADLAGTPMIRRVVDRITPVVDELVVNCRTDQADDIETALAGCGVAPTYAFDDTPDEGPMAGIGRGLRATESDYGLVVACDMPFVDPSFVDYLFDRAAGYDAAVPRPDEWFQTTQAVYRADEMAAACERALDHGEHRIVEALFDVDYVVVDREEITRHTTMATFENLNTREEFEAAVERF